MLLSPYLCNLTKILSKMMLKKSVTNLIVILTLISCAQEVLSDLDSSLTHEFFIDSQEKSKTYRIWVQLPEEYNKSAEKYPTVYVLDPDDKSAEGNSNFFYISKKCKELSRLYKKQDVVVIGIRHGDYREIDYTPTKYSTSGFSGEGGGEKFMNFIKKELIAKVEMEYRVLPDRTQRILIGHSLGGLCGAFAFVKHNEAFGKYFLLSPSLIYDNEIILQYEQETRAKIKSQKQWVYFGVGGTEPNMVPPIELLYNRIKKYYPDTKTELCIIPGKGHNGSKDENIKKALEYYFKNL
jgi:predicted alpha/beta superfamily hydrolase